MIVNEISLVIQNVTWKIIPMKRSGIQKMNPKRSGKRKLM
jgi:hypothetical protein